MFLFSHIILHMLHLHITYYWLLNIQYMVCTYGILSYCIPRCIKVNVIGIWSTVTWCGLVRFSAYPRIRSAVPEPLKCFNWANEYKQLFNLSSHVGRPHLKSKPLGLHGLTWSSPDCSTWMWLTKWYNATNNGNDITVISWILQIAEP